MIKSWLFKLTILGYEEVHVPELTPKSFETDEVSLAVNVHVWCAVWHGCFYGDTQICRPNCNHVSHFLDDSKYIIEINIMASKY